MPLRTKGSFGMLSSPTGYPQSFARIHFTIAGVTDRSFKSTKERRLISVEDASQHNTTQQRLGISIFQRRHNPE